MQRYILAALLAALAATHGNAQWTFMGPTPTTHYVDIAARNGVIIVGSDPGSPPRETFRSTDGGVTWEVVYDNGPRWITAVDTGFIMQSGGRGNARGDASGRVWTTVDNGLPANVVRYYYDRSTAMLYATTQRSALMRSTDQGATWSSMLVPSEDLTFVHARGSRIITGYNNIGGSGSFSADGGATWTSIYTRGVTGGQAAAGFVAEDGSFYVTVTESFFPAAAKLWRSRDDGATWTELTKGVAGIGGIALQMPGMIYAEGSTILFSAGIDLWMSSNDGATWEKRDEGLPASGTGSVSRMIVEGGYAYLMMQAFVPPQTGFGVYRRPLSELGITGSAASVAMRELAGSTLSIAPNPAHDRVTIRLTLEHPSHGRIALHDILGREVAVLHEGTLDAGDHAITLHEDYPTGLYIVRAEIGGAAMTRTFMRVR